MGGADGDLTRHAETTITREELIGDLEKLTVRFLFGIFGEFTITHYVGCARGAGAMRTSS
jgi:hypothetical protein